MSQPVALIWVSDLHTNSTIGLSPPIVTLDDGGTYHASPSQKELWGAWLDFVDWARTETEGCRRVAVFGGDLAEKDDKQRSTQLISRNSTDIHGMVIDTITPLLDLTDLNVFLRGTEAHVGKSASMEERIAQDVDNVYKNGKLYSHWHLRAAFNGVRVDMAHHAGMGSRPWTEKNAANTLAAIVRSRYAEMRQPEPHYVLRGHVHRWADSGQNFAPLTAILAPAWTLKTAFAYRIGAENTLSNIGGFIVRCNSEQEHTFLRKMYPFENRKKLWKQIKI